MKTFFFFFFFWSSPQFCPIFNNGGMNLEPRFCLSELIKRGLKKKVFTKGGTLFFPDFKWTPTLRCTSGSSCWRGGGCRCRPYSNCWEGYSQCIGGIYPPWFRHPWLQLSFALHTKSRRNVRKVWHF